MGAIISLIVAIVMALIAHKKGFAWWLWALAGGIPGFVIILCLSPASASGIDEETRMRRRKKGNIVGGVISVIAIIVTVVFVAVILNL